MTLTEFLLARIAGREAAINFAREHGFAFPVMSPAEMLAECVAKRRLVGLAAEQPETFAEMVAHLAEIYADHPDYNEEWRP